MKLFKVENVRHGDLLAVWYKLKLTMPLTISDIKFPHVYSGHSLDTKGSL